MSKSKQVLFATTNLRKIGEARLACDNFRIDIEQIELDIDEIQNLDPQIIATKKAEEAYRICQKPVVITDTSWNIPALKGFPGGYMKDIAEWFSPDDFIDLMKDKQNKKISFTESIVYKDAKECKVFSEEYWGEIVDKPRGIGKGNSIEYVTAFDGYTIAERHDQNRFTHDPKEYVWYKFAKWFSEKDTAIKKTKN